MSQPPRPERAPDPGEADRSADKSGDGGLSPMGRFKAFGKRLVAVPRQEMLDAEARDTAVDDEEGPS